MQYRRMKEKIWCLSWSIFVLLLTVIAARAGGDPDSCLVPQKQGSRQEILGKTFAPGKMVQLAASTSNANPSKATTPPKSLPNSSKRPMPPTHNAYFCFQKGDLYQEYVLKEISEADDTASWNKIESNGRFAKYNQISEEDGIYFKTEYTDALFSAKHQMTRRPGADDDDPGRLVAPYKMVLNNPSWRQNCAGLSLAKLLKGPYVFPTDQAFKFVNVFSSSRTEYLDPQNLTYKGLRGDVAVYLTKNYTTVHFVLLSGRDRVISKDNEESIHFGDIRDFSAVKPAALINFISFFHLDWDQIKVYRKQPVIITVESEVTGRKIADAQVELLPREPIGKPPRAVWAKQKTDSNGRATFSRYDQPAGKTPEDAPSAFPFELTGRNLTVQVSHPGYEKVRVEEPIGPRPPWDQPLLITVHLKDLFSGGCWRRQEPVLDYHKDNPKGTCQVISPNKNEIMLVMTGAVPGRHGDLGPIVKTTVVLQPPPLELTLGQKVILTATCTSPPVEGMFGHYAPEERKTGTPWPFAAQCHVELNSPCNYGNFATLDGKNSCESSWYFGVPKYVPKAGGGGYKWENPPVSPPPAIELYVQGMGANNFAKLIWRYAPAEAQAPPLAKGSAPSQPQALAIIPVQPDNRPPHFVITPERTMSFGKCPVYKLAIYDDGTVNFEGKKYVVSLGK